MSDYTEFFLNRTSNIIQYETLEISHPNFSQVYYIVRNNTKGLTAKNEDNDTLVFDYYPLRIESGGVKNDLDQRLTVNLGDLGEILPNELDAVKEADGFSTKPDVIYRTYRSDDLENVLFGPVTLEITNIPFKREGCSFEAHAPYVNVNKTGELYTIDRFPMLRGFV